MNNYDYPIGLDNNPEAPWNEKSNKPKKVEVTVSITLSKTVEVEVDDYSIEETDEDGTTIIKREPLYFQPDERCSNIYTRKAMIKNPNIFWSFYDNIVLKD